MRVLDLFSGIGGFSLGLERAGMRTIQFVEIEPYCQAVLRKHWPDVPIHDDIRTFHAPAGFSDVICGGFPCQDVSFAGKGAGLAGSRSGLWSEFARIIGEVRPQYAIVENVPALLGRGLGRVLGDLAEIGYDAEWHCIPASYVGASHIRDRVWIVAHSDEVRELQPGKGEQDQRGWNHPCAEENAANPDSQGLQERFLWTRIQEAARLAVNGKDASLDPWRSTEPALVRKLHGISHRVDRIAALGNAVVPQIPELIGRAIMRAVA